MSEPARRLVSEAEFLALPESMDKVELLDGEVIVSPSPTYFHQHAVGVLHLALKAWARAQTQAWTVVMSPSDVRFGFDRILQPDLYVIEGRVPLDHLGPIDIIPALCVEVTSRDRLYDRVTKRMVYGQAGVREYWVVEATGIERWTGEGLTQAEFLTGTLATPLLPGFTFDVGELHAP